MSSGQSGMSNIPQGQSAPNVGEGTNAPTGNKRTQKNWQSIYILWWYIPILWYRFHKSETKSSEKSDSFPFVPLLRSSAHNTVTGRPVGNIGREFCVWSGLSCSLVLSGGWLLLILSICFRKTHQGSARAHVQGLTQQKTVDMCVQWERWRRETRYFEYIACVVVFLNFTTSHSYKTVSDCFELKLR